MKSSKIFIILVVSILTLNTSGQTKPSDKPKIINLIPQTDIIKFSDVFKSYKIYRLKSDNKHYLKVVTKVIPADDKFIIGAATDDSRVHLFNKNGDYLANVGLVGRGPREYLSVRSLKVYPSQKLIEILDYNKNAILRFSTDDGRYLNELKIRLLLKIIFLPPRLQGTKWHQGYVIKDKAFVILGVFVSWWLLHCFYVFYGDMIMIVSYLENISS